VTLIKKINHKKSASRPLGLEALAASGAHDDLRD
jgi:hypothetical protein